MTASEEDDFSQFDDSTLISKRVAMRAALEALPPFSEAHRRLTAWYDLSTIEMDERARKAWTTNS